MSDIAIRAENLGKRFHIGQVQGGHKTFGEIAVDAFLNPVRRMGKLLHGHAAGAADLNDTIWALRDVRFEIKHGEVVGVIGRNGAGKSTLLKILSRITEPTKGFVEIHGRVGCLLEVGTGFHQELTGRENIYLNGAILGMRKAEIDRKFDEIVDFAGIGRFLDTPVKHYSSGMQTRLGFAVAAHLDPEILIVDEVLAVGDAEFQRKCLGKMGHIAAQGRTVLFVSHNLASLQNLCRRAFLLDGSMLFDGDISEAINLYSLEMRKRSQIGLHGREDRRGTGRARFASIHFEDSNGDRTDHVEMGRKLRIVLEFQSSGPFRPQLGIAVAALSGQRIFRLAMCDHRVEMPEVQGKVSVSCEIESIPLLPGSYSVKVVLEDNKGELQDEIQGAATFDVMPADVFGAGRIPKGPGDIVFVDSRWSFLYGQQESLTSCHRQAIDR